MKFIPAILAIAICSSSFSFGQDAPPPVAKARAKVEATDVTPDEAEKLIAETPGLAILDVRTPEEFEHGHIKGAVNYNLHDVAFEQQVAAMDQKKPVLIHCQAGSRSSQALMELAGKTKFPKVYHLRAGFSGWKNAKKPIEGKPLPGLGRLAPGDKPAPAKPKQPQ